MPIVEYIKQGKDWDGVISIVFTTNNTHLVYVDDWPLNSKERANFKRVVLAPGQRDD